jgi:hypothetical protein
LSAKAPPPQARQLLARALREPSRQGRACARHRSKAFIEMSRRQLLAARLSVSSIALTCAAAAWALVSELLSRM